MDKNMLKKVLLIAIPILFVVIGVTLGIVFSCKAPKEEYVTIAY